MDLFDLKELDWMPSVRQVAGTLPCSFKERNRNTYAIIDGSEIFIETPSDLHMQSSTWSQYKHHNTTNNYTLNGAICYVSYLSLYIIYNYVYISSISDVQRTCTCAFLFKLEDKPKITLMADRGFTKKKMLKQLNI